MQAPPVLYYSAVCRKLIEGGAMGNGQDDRSRETATVVEAARRLGVGRNQAYEAIKRGEIPAIRVGKRLLVPTAWLERVLSGSAA